MDKISINGLEVQCLVGLLSHERKQAQPLVLDMDLTCSVAHAGDTERLSDTWDYAALAGQARFILEHGRFRLLETAAQSLARYFLLPPANMQSASISEICIKMTKPMALGGRGIPSITITRRQADMQYVTETKPFGTVDIIQETQDVGIYRLNIAPARGIPLHVHRQMHEVELVLTEGLLSQGKPVSPGILFRWPHDLPHRYDNPTDQMQSILCIDAPKFRSDDEIEVPQAHALMQEVVGEALWTPISNA